MDVVDWAKYMYKKLEEQEKDDFRCSCKRCC